MSDKIRAKHYIVKRYWLEYYLDDKYGLCSLCGNSGKIDTRQTAISAAGKNAGRINYCICPNGQELRKVYQ